MLHKHNILGLISNNSDPLHFYFEARHTQTAKVKSIRPPCVSPGWLHSFTQIHHLMCEKIQLTSLGPDRRKATARPRRLWLFCTGELTKAIIKSMFQCQHCIIPRCDLELWPDPWHVLNSNVWKDHPPFPLNCATFCESTTSRTKLVALFTICTLEV